jgi:hypothetical protein
MKIIREKRNTGVTALPLNEKSHPEIEITVKTAGVGIGYLDRRKSG